MRKCLHCVQPPPLSEKARCPCPVIERDARYASRFRKWARPADLLTSTHILPPGSAPAAAARLRTYVSPDIYYPDPFGKQKHSVNGIFSDRAVGVENINAQPWTVRAPSQLPDFNETHDRFRQLDAGVVQYPWHDRDGFLVPPRKWYVTFRPGTIVAVRGSVVVCPLYFNQEYAYNLHIHGKAMRVIRSAPV